MGLESLFNFKKLFRGKRDFEKEEESFTLIGFERINVPPAEIFEEYCEWIELDKKNKKKTKFFVNKDEVYAVAHSTKHIRWYRYPPS